MLRFASLLALLTTFVAISGCASAKPTLAPAIRAAQGNVFKESMPTQPVSASSMPEAARNNSANGGQTPMKPEQGILEFSENDSGKNISITTGVSIIIRLNSQLSTGYNWTVSGMDDSIIVQEGEPQYTAFSKLIGGGETVVWKFKSKGVGNAVLKLVYARAFEKDKPPLKTFELMIKVEE